MYQELKTGQLVFLILLLCLLQFLIPVIYAGDGEPEVVKNTECLVLLSEFEDIEKLKTELMVTRLKIKAIESDCQDPEHCTKSDLLLIKNWGLEVRNKAELHTAKAMAYNRGLFNIKVEGRECKAEFVLLEGM